MKKGEPMIRVEIAVVSIALLGASPLLSQDLREAVRTNNVERVRTILESGADARTSYKNRIPPIYFASSPEVVDLLLAHGAELDIRADASLQSPIECAAENFFRDKEHRENWRVIVDKMRDAGAKYTIDTAIYMNDVDFVREQLNDDASWVNKTPGAESVPLRLAARTGRVEICRLLLRHNADPDSFEEGNGYPVIVDAVSHPAIVRMLIESGADLKTRITWTGGRTGFWVIGDDATALHFAARDGVPETIALLIDNDVDIFAVAHDSFHKNDRQTALEVAAFFGRSDNADAILSHPKFDQAGQQLRKRLLDKCLLIGAARNGLGWETDRPKLIATLLKEGADPNATRDGVTAMQIAARQIHPDEEEENTEIKKVISVLAEYDANPDLFSVVAVGNETQVARLLQQNPASANSRGPDGYPSLHFAVRMNYRKIVKYLLDAGGDVGIRSKSEGTGYVDETALHCAAFWGRYEIAKLLIDAGADVNALTKRKSTPLHSAARMVNVRVARLLLENRAKIDARDKDGKTPLDWCRKLRGTDAYEIEKVFREFRMPTQ